MEVSLIFVSYCCLFPRLKLYFTVNDSFFALMFNHMLFIKSDQLSKLFQLSCQIEQARLFLGNFSPLGFYSPITIPVAFHFLA